MHTPNPETSEELMRWFRERLDARNIRFDAEPFSYEGNTAYDRAFHQLLEEARQVWLARYGYAPTPGQLTTAFFHAESERFRAARRSWPARLADTLRRIFSSR